MEKECVIVAPNAKSCVKRNSKGNISILEPTDFDLGTNWIFQRQEIGANEIDSRDHKILKLNN